jgi:threonine/homoserine/homoserine lactone efflux protein
MSFICFLGAITPGPSLAVVVRNTIARGRKQGVLTGIGHGTGLTIYAFIALFGLTSIVYSNVYILKIIKLFGIIILLKISFELFFKKNVNKNSEIIENENNYGFFDGFLISFFNPKILVFFTALFSQFLSKELKLADKTFIPLIVGIIDASWYIFIAFTLTNSGGLIKILKENQIYVDRAIGLILMLISFLLIYKNFINL